MRLAKICIKEIFELFAIASKLKAADKLWILIFLFLFNYEDSSSQPAYLKKIDKSYNDFGTAYSHLLDYYIYDLDPEELMNAAILGMLSSLDPYSELLSEQEIESFQSLENNYFTGIGIYREHLKRGITIMDLLEGSPAYKSGIKIGDIITSVEGISCESFNSDSLRKYLKGIPGTFVELKIRRAVSGQTYTFKVERKEIPQNSLRYSSLINDSTVYLQMIDFSANTKTEVLSALSSLEKKSSSGIKSIILDLRNNGGGIMLSSLELFEIFMKPNTLFGSIRNKSGIAKELRSKNEPIYPNVKLAVLVNNLSASASEFLAASLQDYDRAVIIGNKTYGKGISQIIKDLPSGKSLKVTIEVFSSPMNRIINQIRYIPKYIKSDTIFQDSIIYSKNGRALKNHSAVHPDIEILNKEYPSIVYNLEEEKMFFDFASVIASEYNSLPMNFQITDEIYTRFKEFCFTKDTVLSKEYEKQFETAMNSLIKDSAEAEVIEEFRKFKSVYLTSAGRDLDRFRPLISEVLFNTIISRFWNYSETIENYLKKDEPVIEAVKVLNSSRYKEILKIKPKH